MNLLTRRHGDGDAVGVATDATARSLAVDAVDAALARCAGRKRFTDHEAAAIVGDVRAQVDVLGPPATHALDDAVASLGTEALVDGGRLTDALLDLRLALRR